MFAEWSILSPIRQKLARLGLVSQILMCVDLSLKLLRKVWLKSSLKVVILCVPLMRWIMSISGVFPVEIDLEGPLNHDGEDRGNVPTPEHERHEAMPSDLGERKEVIPKEPESDFSEEFEEPQLLGSLGHWPYDKGCGLVVGLLQGDVDIRVVMRAVQPLRH